jgi:hypothetical protein
LNPVCIQNRITSTLAPPLSLDHCDLSSNPRGRIINPLFATCHAGAYVAVEPHCHWSG